MLVVLVILEEEEEELGSTTLVDDDDEIPSVFKEDALKFTLSRLSQLPPLLASYEFVPLLDLASSRLPLLPFPDWVSAELSLPARRSLARRESLRICSICALVRCRTASSRSCLSLVILVYAPSRSLARSLPSLINSSLCLVRSPFLCFSVSFSARHSASCSFRSMICCIIASKVALSGRRGWPDADGWRGAVCALQLALVLPVIEPGEKTDEGGDSRLLGDIIPKINAKIQEKK